METVPFPVDVLRPARGRATPQEAALDIQIPLEPFELPEIGPVQTKLSIEPTELPRSASALSEQIFELPSNPEPGYVDASMYIEHRHHIVDVHRISFGKADGNTISARFDCTILFSVEGLAAADEREYADTPWQFSCWIDFEPYRDAGRIANERWLKKLARRLGGR